ncbi:MAG: VTC domain-containing protein [Methanomicrobia archaeon]|nr:VTC domain-containing protein [Methanomicrobia archaeon]
MCQSSVTICNIYFDSPQYDLIRKSIEKPVYKDKVRIRSYNIPNKNSEVYSLTTTNFIDTHSHLGFGDYKDMVLARFGDKRGF